MSNSLPSGWKRLQGSYQPGDIAVWPVNHSYANETVSEYSLRRAVENIGIVEIERAIERKLLRTEQQKPKKIDLLKEYKEIEGVYSRKRKSKNIANYVGEVHWICRSCKQINGSDQTCLSCHKANVKWRKSKA